MVLFILLNQVKWGKTKYLNWVTIHIFNLEFLMPNQRFGNKPVINS